MKKIFKTFLIVGCLLATSQCQQKTNEATKPISIVPQPINLIQAAGSFQLNSKTKISCVGDLTFQAEQLVKLLKPATGFELAIENQNLKKNVISLTLDNALEKLGEEGYHLLAGPKRIKISAFTEKGIFYGIQSLRQLLSEEIESVDIVENQTWEIPCLSIQDNPRFKWRGLMLDCSRTFWNVDYVKRTIRLMSLYKLNVLHLHLTDDQGWRIAIDKYPELTQKGAQFPSKWKEPKERQGYYSKKDIREIVEYARQHNITVVPEIEMPGHSLEVLACYPELSCTGGPFEIHPFFKGPGIHKDILCAGNEQVFEFLEGVLSEVIEMFPGEYIHIGGDEAPKHRWEECEKCQARMKNEGLADEHELQSWFIKRIEAFINKKGRKIIGWDEILEGGLAPNAAVMSWRGIKGGEKAAKENHNVVMSPTSHCYFDYTYKRISTMKAYEYEPVPEGISIEQSKYIMGAQANFWSHIDRTEAGVDKQLFPRILSIAEVAWSSKESRDRIRFKTNVNQHLNRLEKLGVNYYNDSTLLLNN